MNKQKPLYREYKAGREHSIKSASYLLNKLGNPEKKLQFIHVAGTNGKGSTCAMISSILIQSGYNVGLFTSPHLMTHHERIRVNNQLISEERLSSLFHLIDSEEEKMVQKGYRKLTLFSKYMIASFLYFQEKRVDFVVLEVGIGGRYDATNVIENSVISVITPIGIDHSDILGSTLGEIAFDKAGIIKDHGVLINANKNSEVNNVIRLVAKEKNARVFMTEHVTDYTLSLDGTIFNYNGKKYKTNLIGEYQVVNALTAIKAIEVLSANYSIKASAIEEGLQTVNFNGRVEVIGRTPTVIIDGAHNPHATKALAVTLSKLRKKRKVIAIVGFKEGKDFKEMLDIISPLCQSIIVTKPVAKEAVRAEKIVEQLHDFHGAIYSYELIEDAIKKARELATVDDIIIGFGSFYLIGAIKEIFLKK